jgi:hypothetical protein
MSHPQPPNPYTATASYGVEDTTAEQIRESLQRQRRWNVGFDLAWRLAVKNIRHAHDRETRQAAYVAIACPRIRAAWEAAYNNEPGPADVVGVLLAVLGNPELTHQAVRRRGGGAESKRHHAVTLG